MSGRSIVAVPVALSIAGSDPSGGAGIQADLKTFAALGVYGAAALTALTAQNTLGVSGVMPVPADFVTQQVVAVLSDLPVQVVKLGMLGSAASVAAIAEVLGAHFRGPVVLDPVMIAKSGHALLAPEAVQVLREQLLPRATVLLPNAPEAAVLLACSEADILDNPWRACARLAALGPRVVVLKGGHMPGPHCIDRVWDGETRREHVHARISTKNTHGTGCTLSAAVAAWLALGASLGDAVARASDYVHGAIAAACDWSLGAGHGPLDHLHLRKAPSADLA